MLLESWLRSTCLKLQSPRRRTQALGRRRSPNSMGSAQVSFVEPLEHRILLDAVSWTGAAGNLDWSNAANWTGGTGAPKAGDDVTIGYLGGSTIEVSGVTIDIG